MTVKEDLRRAVEQLDDETAAIALGYVRWAVSKDIQMLETIARRLLGQLAAEDPARVRALLDALAADDPEGVALALVPRTEEPETGEDGPAAAKGSARPPGWPVVRRGRVLTADDLLPAEPIMPDDETPDMLNEAVRQWRREGGYA
jgi:hypothetical protein